MKSTPPPLKTETHSSKQEELNEEELIHFFTALAKVDSHHPQIKAIEFLKTQLLKLSHDPENFSFILLTAGLQRLNKITDEKNRVFDNTMKLTAEKVLQDIATQNGLKLKNIIKEMNPSLQTIIEDNTIIPPHKTPVIRRPGLDLSERNSAWNQNIKSLLFQQLWESSISSFLSPSQTSSSNTNSSALNDEVGEELKNTTTSKENITLIKKEDDIIFKKINIQNFHRDVRANDLKAVQAWCQQYKNQIDAVNSAGETALHIAAKAGNLEIVRYLLSIGANPDLLNEEKQAVIHIFIEKGNSQGLNILLNESKADINLKGAMDSTSNDFPMGTPLHAAIGHGRNELLQILLTHKANPYLTNDNKESPMDFALDNNHLPAIKILLLGVSNMYKQTPLDRVVKLMTKETSIDKELFEFVVEHGANLTQVCDTAKNMSVFHYLCRFGTAEIIEIAIRNLQKQPDAEKIFNQKSGEGKTALDYLNNRKYNKLDPKTLLKLSNALKPIPSLSGLNLHSQTADIKAAKASDSKPPPTPLSKKKE